MSDPNELFWTLAEHLYTIDPRVNEGTMMGGRCLRVGTEFLALVGFKDAGLVTKLPRHRVTGLIDDGVGQPFAPAGRVFKEWISIPEPDHDIWLGLLIEAITFVAGD